MFQSLSGVLDVCNILAILASSLTIQVSIPFRGFRCLQPSNIARLVPMRIRVSIPFRGFRCLQLNLSIISITVILMFQSLSGVLDVCNVSLLMFFCIILTMFQSLSGVLDVCNHTLMLPLKIICCRVSIPFRGFRCLQLKYSRG